MLDNTRISDGKKYIRSTFRPAEKALINAPIRVRSTGHYIVSPDWTDYICAKNFLELFWCVSGCGGFVFQDNGAVLNSGDICCYFPNDVHRISALSENFNYYWVTFDGDNLDLLIKQFALQRRPQNVGVCPEELFLALEQAVQSVGQEGEAQAGVIGYEILCRARKCFPQPDNSLLPRFKALLEKQYSCPDFNVEEAAKILDVHRTTLTRTVKLGCGVTPKEYLVSFRLQKALQSLLQTSKSIKEIATETGFADQNYFGKVFLRRFKNTPSAMRQQQ